MTRDPAGLGGHGRVPGPVFGHGSQRDDGGLPGPAPAETVTLRSTGHSESRGPADSEL